MSSNTGFHGAQTIILSTIYPRFVESQALKQAASLFFPVFLCEQGELKIGAPGGARTHNLLLLRQSLCRTKERKNHGI